MGVHRTLLWVDLRRAEVRLLKKSYLANPLEVNWVSGLSKKRVGWWVAHRTLRGFQSIHGPASLLDAITIRSLNHVGHASDVPTPLPCVGGRDYSTMAPQGR